MKLEKITLLFLLLVLPAIMYFYLTKGYNNFIKLEVIGEVDYSIDDFSFINQDNDTITKDSLAGSIYVANFFFTSCPSICPIMTRNMSYLQDKLSVFPNIRFLSHTVDPVNDTPDKLKSYVNLMQQKNININLSNWDNYTKHDYSDFDATKTWIEFLNRLIGVIAGIATLVMLIFSFSYWNEKKILTLNSFLIIFGSIPLIFKFPSVRAAAIK